MRPLPSVILALLVTPALAGAAPVTTAAVAPAPPSRTAAWASFAARETGDWRVRWDERAGTPGSIRARRAPPLPGWSAGHGAALRGFFARNRELFGLRADLDEFVPAGERTRGGVHHVRMRQLHRGIQVVGGEYMASVGGDGGLRMLAGRAVPVPDVDVRPAFDAARAGALARAAVPPVAGPVGTRTELAVRVRDQRADLVYRTTLSATDAPWWWRVTIDARSGAVLEVTDLALREGYDGVGRGNVADPSPDFPLVDTTLTHLRDDRTLLEGRYVKVTSDQRDPITSVDGGYYFYPCTTTMVPYLNPYDEVSAYWHIDDFLARYLEPLGFALPSPMPARVHVLATNRGLAFTTDAGAFFTQAIGLGCCAEDADIVDHESGHYVLVSLGIDGSGLAGKDMEPLAIHEGYADWFAATATRDPCLGEFSYRHMRPGYGIVRCVQNDPAVYNYARYDSVGGACMTTTFTHCCGMIWSGALWDLRTALPEVTERLVVESLEYLPATVSFGLGYDALCEADLDLHGGADLDSIQAIFSRRGIDKAAWSGFVLDVKMSGPGEVALGDSGTYSVTVRRGFPPYRYAWSQYMPTSATTGHWVPLPAEGPTAVGGSARTTSFGMRCRVTDARDLWGIDSLAVRVVIPRLAVQVRQPAIATIWGGSARDTALGSGGLPPLGYTWRRLDGYWSPVLSTGPAVVDSPVIADHLLSVEVHDALGTQSMVYVPVTLPYGRPAVRILGPRHLCCTAAPDTFLAVVAKGHPPYRYTWRQQASSGGAWIRSEELLTGTAIRRDSSFVLELTVVDADGVDSPAAFLPVDPCGPDACLSQVAIERGVALLAPSPVHASAGPVKLVAQVAEAAGARLELYDLTGRRVRDLGRGALRDGANEIRWQCDGTEAGVYFLRLSTGGKDVIRKIVVLP